MYPELSKDAKPDFESHGNSFLKGVKFSVHTISRGNVAYLKLVSKHFQGELMMLKL